MEKHPAAEQPHDGAPQEDAGQARGWGNPLWPGPGTAGPAAQLLGGGLLREHQAAAHPPSALVLLPPSGLRLSGSPFCLVWAGE